MSVYIKPCRGCRLSAGCDLRRAWTDKLSGLGLRSAFFNCERLKSEMRIGRRITVLAPICAIAYGRPDSSEYESVERLAVKATITTVDRGFQFTCTIDPGQIDAEDLFDNAKGDINAVRFWKWRSYQKIASFLDEPDEVLCKGAHVMRAGKCDTRGDEKCIHTDQSFREFDQ